MATKTVAKWGYEYSVVLGWLRCCVGFSLLRSAIQCIRGAHSSIGTYTSGYNASGVPLVRVTCWLHYSTFLVLFSCLARAFLCAGGGRQGQSIKPGLKKKIKHLRLAKQELPVRRSSLVLIIKWTLPIIFSMSSVHIDLFARLGVYCCISHTAYLMKLKLSQSIPLSL